VRTKVKASQRFGDRDCFVRVCVRGTEPWTMMVLTENALDRNQVKRAFFRVE